MVTGIEVIAAALAAGATAGVTGAASTAVEDAYANLRDLLRRRLAGRGQAEQALEADETEAGRWEADLGADLVQVGADRDEGVLTAAGELLELVAAARSSPGDQATTVHVGDGSVHVENNYGAAAGTMTGPVTINHGREPLPPGSPATA